LNRSTVSEEDVLKDLVVAIDGPAGSGKSTTARLVAERLGCRHIDTGAMYRAVALAVLRAGVDPGDEPACGALAAFSRIEFGNEPRGGQSVSLDGTDVTLEIRTPEVTRAVSPVSAHPSVRKGMVRQQRELAEEGGAVLEGRDIGTVVLPSADVKIYLVASKTVRAERRLKDLEAQGVETSLGEVEREIARRDEYDASRETSPLRRAVGSIEVDTSNLTIAAQVERIVAVARGTAGRLADLEPVPGYRRYGRFRPHYGFVCWVIRTVLRILFGLHVRRESNVDYNENYIFACNHKSYADPPFVGSSLDREAHIIAKASLFRNAAFAWLIRSFNAIPLRRGVFDRDAMKLVLELLGKRESLLIFPEGSRVHKKELGSPKSGVGFLAVNAGTAVVPVFASGTDALWRCLFRRERLYVAIGRPIRLDPSSREEFADNDGYRAYSEMVMEAIRALKDQFESAAGGRDH
jgi:cytidylate kinase